MLAQLATIRLDDNLVSQVVGALDSAQRPVSLDRARLERSKRELALDHAAGRLDDASYLERHRRLQGELDALDRSSQTGAPAPARSNGFGRYR